MGAGASSSERRSLLSSESSPPLVFTSINASPDIPLPQKSISSTVDAYNQYIVNNTTPPGYTINDDKKDSSLLLVGLLGEPAALFCPAVYDEEECNVTWCMLTSRHTLADDKKMIQCLLSMSFADCQRINECVQESVVEYNSLTITCGRDGVRKILGNGTWLLTVSKKNSSFNLKMSTAGCDEKASDLRSKIKAALTEEADRIAMEKIEEMRREERIFAERRKQFNTCEMCQLYASGKLKDDGEYSDNMCHLVLCDVCGGHYAWAELYHPRPAKRVWIDGKRIGQCIRYIHHCRCEDKQQLGPMLGDTWPDETTIDDDS